MIGPVGIAVILCSYLIGNISPAIILGKMYGVDIKKEGSGNAVTTYFLRVIGKKAAVVTLIIDVLKGVVVVLLCKYFFTTDVVLICGIAVVCGHIWPVFFKFKGGKGVATALGVILTTAPLLGLAILGGALAIMAVSRRVSVGSCIAALAFPVAAYFYDSGLLIWAAVLAVIIIVKHRQNIKRIFKGEEPKLSFKKRGS
jgi:glycerol-3-phosphate acyltransferase PlsY